MNSVFSVIISTIILLNPSISLDKFDMNKYVEMIIVSSYEALYDNINMSKEGKEIQDNIEKYTFIYQETVSLMTEEDKEKRKEQILLDSKKIVHNFFTKNNINSFRSFRKYYKEQATDIKYKRDLRQTSREMKKINKSIEKNHQEHKKMTKSIDKMDKDDQYTIYKIESIIYDSISDVYKEGLE